ncbi:putative PurR-regulated permease PerM [Alkalibacterium olivapovliticus]|uniref:Putative PurR-regulated permease PerM n=2 Tax=Alkalibacterium olivapovliticus TaxID=99907 RepID=A0A2T0W639_9LACT|nr:putative PurR-regulated permease PerM [Alkalibacterium olivapovliticus]
MNQESNEKKPVQWNKTWFWRSVINNKLVSALIVMLLVFINIYMLTRISYIFRPVGIILSIIGPPLIFSVIFYYLLNPIVDWLEKKRFSRNTAIAFVFSLIILGMIGGSNFIFPIIQEQLQSLIENWPTYWNNLMLQLNGLLNTQAFTEIMDQFGDTTILETVSNQTSSVVNATMGSIGSFIGTITQIVITLITMPFVLYYLLKDGKKIPPFVTKYIPIQARPRVNKLFYEINKQVSFYVRGQLIVAISVGFIFWIGFSIVGLDFALTLGIFAGFMNLIPYLGSFIASIPALIIAVVHSPFMLVKVLIVFGIEQILENRIISPQIIGNTLKIHPVNIIFLLLIGGRLFGLIGIVFGIPGYAIIKIIVSMAFDWYRDTTGWYDVEDAPIDTSEALVKVKNRK